LTGAPQPAPVRTLASLLFALFAGAYALFTQDPLSHNTLCRAAMTANMVQHGRVDINGYENYTRDKAANRGNYYCDKAPGMSYLAAPAAFVFTRFTPIDADAPYTRAWSLFLYVCAISTSGLLVAAVAGFVLFHFVRARTKSLDAAMVAAIAFGLGTSVWGGATSFFSHAATAALLVSGYIALDECYRSIKESQPFGVAALLAGVTFGAAASVEYTSVIASAGIGLILTLPSLKAAPYSTLRACGLAGAAAFVVLIPTLIFHAVAFGSPFETGYAYTVDFDLHRTGVFGVGVPQPDILMQLLISEHRGVIWYSPIILAIAWVAVRGLRTGATVPASFASLLVLAFYLLMNAGFGYWEGGASTGPRYLTPGVGFAAMALGLGWPNLKQWERAGVLILLAISVAVNFACTAVGMTIGALLDEILPRLASGDLQSTLTYRLLDEPSFLHFLGPAAFGGLMTWLIARERKRALCSPTTGSRLA
jgi:hypothetical protein